MIPQLAQLLSPEEVQRIHEASLEILDQVGLEVNNPRARERFREHGCRVDDDITIEHSVIKSRHVHRVMRRDGSVQPVRYVLTQPEGLDSIAPLS